MSQKNSEGFSKSLFQMLSFLLASACCYIGTADDFVRDMNTIKDAIAASNFRDVTVSNSETISVETATITQVNLGVGATVTIKATRLSRVVVECGSQSTINLDGPIILEANSGEQVTINSNVKNGISPIVYCYTSYMPTISFINKGGNSDMTSMAFTYSLSVIKYEFKWVGLNLTQNYKATEGIACGYEGVTRKQASEFGDISFYDFKIGLSVSAVTAIVVVVFIVVILLIVASLFCCACWCPLCCPCLSCLLFWRKKGDPDNGLDNNDNSGNNMSL